MPGLTVSPLCRVIVDNDYQGDPDGSRSAASAAIVDEARRDDELPLYLACGGPLTNVATALRDAPDIAARLTLVWIGGSLESSAFEYNRDTDQAAAELEHDLSGCGLLGQWLWEHFCDPPDWVRIGGVWPLGDSPTVLVTALSTESSVATLLPPQASHGGRRVYTDLDFRLLVADMLARFRLHERHRKGFL